MSEYGGVLLLGFVVLTGVIATITNSGDGDDGEAGVVMSLPGISKEVQDDLFNTMVRVLFLVLIISAFFSGKALIVVIFLPLIAIGMWIWDVNMKRQEKLASLMGRSQEENANQSSAFEVKHFLDLFKFNESFKEKKD
eukprot:g2966.t1